MPWTGDTFTSLLLIAELHAVYTDMTALMAQNSGAPVPSGVWSHTGTIRVASAFFVPGSADIGVLTVDSGLYSAQAAAGAGVPRSNRYTGDSFLKAWGFISQAGSVFEGFNCVASRISAGRYAFAFSLALTASFYPVQVAPHGPNFAAGVLWSVQSTAPGGFGIGFDTVALGAADPSSGFSITVQGR